ncbi:hypothetical protein [Mycobacterium sp. E1747]|uniref:hypothetical protein n=1 Tax=Mycobacterium sp. E1747 TaxID=1834128 RepID=UPI000AC47AC0|nr:hypothetical protein [Mycobacterium sp. E1747]
MAPVSSEGHPRRQPVRTNDSGHVRLFALPAYPAAGVAREVVEIVQAEVVGPSVSW